MSFGAGQPFVTVIIPAYNAHSVLPGCLKSLSEQTYARSCYEVIVVDNGSIPSLKPVVEQFADVTYLLETKPSSYAARNLGLKHARGDVLAFTDADCIPSPNWIECGVRRLLETPNCGQVGGHIQVTYQTPHKPSVLEFCDYLCHGGFPQRHFVEDDHFAATANAFMTREAMEKVGPFNGGLKSSGDLDWGTRAFRLGYGQVYDANTIVAHPARSTLRQLISKSRRLQGGVRDFLRHGAGKDLPKIVRQGPRSLKSRLIPAFLWLMREDYRRVKSTRSVMGERIRISLFTLVGTVAVLWLLRFIRSFEKLRLTLGARSFRG